MSEKEHKIDEDSALNVDIEGSEAEVESEEDDADFHIEDKIPEKVRPAISRSSRPIFKKGHQYVAVTDIAKYDLKSGDDFPNLKAHVLRYYYNNRRIGFKHHIWTKQAIESYKNGHRIRPFAIHSGPDQKELAKAAKHIGPLHPSKIKVKKGGKKK